MQPIPGLPPIPFRVYALLQLFSQYGQPTAPAYTNPTIVNANAASLWSRSGALTHSPMLPRLTRGVSYNSLINRGTVNLHSTVCGCAFSGILGHSFGRALRSPPPMTPSAYPAPTPTPNPNPALNSQLNDNVGIIPFSRSLF